MDLVGVLWSMGGAASLTLAVAYALIWVHRRSEHAYLAFVITAIAASAISIFELALMRAQTIERYADLLKWIHVPIAFLVIGLVVFVRLYLAHGRAWLMWSVIGLRLLVLAVSLSAEVSVNYRSITALRQVEVFTGETVTVPDGVGNPWTIVAEISSLLLLIYVIDAAATAWRHGRRRQAWAVGGSILLFLVIAAGHTALVHHGVLSPPYLIGFAFLGIVVAMARELCRDALQSSVLSRDLEQSRSALRDLEMELRLAAQAVDLGFWSWEVGGDSVWMTPIGRRLFGVSADEAVTPDRLLATIHPEDRAIVRRAIDEAIARSGEFVCEHRVEADDEPARWVLLRGAVEQDGATGATLVRGVAIDVSDRRRAEEQFRTLVEASPNAVVMVDGGGRIVLVNAQAEKMFGYSRSELIGGPIEMLVPGRFAERSQAAGADGMRVRSMGEGIGHYGLRQDGSEFPIAVGLSPVRMPDGEFQLAAIADVTEWRRIEQESARQRDELAHLMRATLLGELSGALAHELNQPLTAILSNAQAALRFLARPDADLQEVRQILHDIVDQDKRAGEVIRRLRMLLKKGEATREAIGVPTLIADVLRLVRSDLMDHRVEVATDTADGVRVVFADRVQIQQVLLNLVMNACQAMANTPVKDRRLTIRAANHGAGVWVSVSDAGPGIPEEHLGRVFDPFVTTKSQGMGLGLAVCRTIVTAHGGKLWASNNYMGGATLHLLLPSTGDTGHEAGANDDLRSG